MTFPYRHQAVTYPMHAMLFLLHVNRPRRLHLPGRRHGLSPRRPSIRSPGCALSRDAKTSGTSPFGHMPSCKARESARVWMGLSMGMGASPVSLAVQRPGGRRRTRSGDSRLRIDCCTAMIQSFNAVQSRQPTSVPSKILPQILPPTFRLPCTWISQIPGRGEHIIRTSLQYLLISESKTIVTQRCYLQTPQLSSSRSSRVCFLQPLA
ncbi:hypothetical protein B0T25DRAFT_286689 [Lasiosphaeria hispida]|uniref:Uncharacterized protein n=1 Tax=Lasiosphaeria hispida TaxID=260671 RepID=A0AAJ0HCC4_9PEZI|nr:hypothetical protein B0T25DRAFT_286689 [Lasiosphaeria hispida]